MSATGPLRAVLLMSAGCALLTGNDAIMKHVTASVPLGEAIFVRGLFAVVAVLLLARRAGGLHTLRVQQWRTQLLRGLLLGVSTLCFLGSLAHLPIAEATALVFASPVMLTALAPWLLGEQVTRRQWLAVVVGFIGVLVMLRPGGEGPRLAVLLPLAAAFSEALRDVVTRRLVPTESSESMLFVSVLTVNVLALGSIGFGWQALDAAPLAWLALAGALLGVAHFCMTDAFRWASAVTVAPFRYSGVLWALLAGMLLFAEYPDAWALVGAALVVGSGLYVLRLSLR